MPKEVLCGECGAPMVLRKSKEFLYESGTARLYFACSRFPVCRSTCGAKPDGSPIGTPCNAETKTVRHETYLALENFRIKRKWNRRGTYSWLSARLKTPRESCHVSYFDIPTCKRVIEILTRATERLEKEWQDRHKAPGAG